MTRRRPCRTRLPVQTPRLSPEDEAHIQALFQEHLVPKLKRLGARVGVLSCDFAGKGWRNWALRFASSGTEFHIVEIEYDPDASPLELDL